VLEASPNRFRILIRGAGVIEAWRGDFGAVPAVRRPARHILGVAAIEVATYLVTDYPSGTRGTVVLWEIATAYLLWRIWQGGRVAWGILYVLVMGTTPLLALAICGVGHTGQSGFWLFCQVLMVAGELVLLTRQPVLRWVYD